jgi:hypothetical protein
VIFHSYVSLPEGNWVPGCYFFHDGNFEATKLSDLQGIWSTNFPSQKWDWSYLSSFSTNLSDTSRKKVHVNKPLLIDQGSTSTVFGTPPNKQPTR